MYYIYRITNKLNGKTYIGKHKYKKLNEYYMGSGVHLKRAQKKYGIENFEKKILVFNISKLEHANLLEETFIAAEREKVGRENCYNIADGGDGGNLGEEVNKKLRGENNPFYGKHHSEEAKKKMSEARKNKKFGHCSEETKRKIAEGNKGKHFSEERKKNIAESLKGHTPWNKGKKTGSNGTHWYNNGEVNVKAKECPKGFVKGRLRIWY